jgi:hypothetical protein
METAEVLHETPCIFLENDTCGVYPDRPLVCRAWHSLDKNACRNHFESATSRPEVDGYRHRHYTYKTVSTGMLQALTEIGCQAGRFALPNAIQEYYRHPAPEDAWIRGESVFSRHFEIDAS